MSTGGAEVLLIDSRVSAPRPSRAEVLDYRGCLGTLRDAAGRCVWTPALPGATDDVRHDWYGRLRDAGAVQVPIGPFGPGPSYPGIVAWDNPDWRNDAAAIRGLVSELIDAGFVPVIFTDGGPRNPKPRIEALFPVLAQALDGLDDHVLVMPCGWEPVVGDFTSAEVSWALREWKRMRPNGLIGYHGSPARLVGSSNPVEPDDPWQGGESIFYTSHGGEDIDIALYQTPHCDDLYRGCSCANWADKFGHEDRCWLNRFEDYVARIGAGHNGWRKLQIVLFEVGTYETTRGEKTADESIAQSRLARDRVAAKWGVHLGFGDGLP